MQKNEATSPPNANSKLDGFIREVMTPLPLVVESSASFHTVDRLLQRYDIRHLPVVDDHKIIGVISDREVEAIKRSQNLAKEADAIRPFVLKAFLEVDAEAPTMKVIEEMALKKYDCAFIVKDKKVTGIFTLSDALGLLLLERGTR